jgi:hypothetical protein
MIFLFKNSVLLSKDSDSGFGVFTAELLRTGIPASLQGMLGAGNLKLNIKVHKQQSFWRMK